MLICTMIVLYFRVDHTDDDNQSQRGDANEQRQRDSAHDASRGRRARGPESTGNERRHKTGEAQPRATIIQAVAADSYTIFHTIGIIHFWGPVADSNRTHRQNRTQAREGNRAR